MQIRVIPVRLETFNSYGLAFQSRMVPELERKVVVGVDRGPQGFRLLLEDGESVNVHRVVLAIGITHFEHIPKHSGKFASGISIPQRRQSQLARWRGRSVIVIGGELPDSTLAGLLHEAGATFSWWAAKKS